MIQPSTVTIFIASPLRNEEKKSMLIVLSTFVFCILETVTFSGVTLTFSQVSLDDSVTGLQIIRAHQGDVMLAWPPQKQSCLLTAASLNNRKKALNWALAPSAIFHSLLI